MLAACSSEFGQPDRVVQAFYDAAIRGDVAAAGKNLASAHAQQAGEIVRTASREGTLQRAELVSTDVWSEHGAVCEVRKHFAAGTSELVRIDVHREAGDWKVAAAKPGIVRRAIHRATVVFSQTLSHAGAVCAARLCSDAWPSA